MALQELKLENEQQEVDRRQIVGRLAVGVVPEFNSDVILVRRGKNQLVPNLYSILTGHVETFPLPPNFDVYDLSLALMGEQHHQETIPRMQIENPLWAALRELYEELYSNRRKVLDPLQREPLDVYQKMLYHDIFAKYATKHKMEEKMNIVDSTTGYLLNIYTAKLFDKKFSLSEISDARPVSQLKQEEINPLSQFCLYILGYSDKVSSKISFSKIREIKDTFAWREVPNTYMISY